MAKPYEDDEQPEGDNRSYVFTAHDVEGFIKIYDEGIWEDSNIRYVVAQLEKAPKTGKMHMQGYVELYEPRKYSSLMNKGLFPVSTWFYYRKGTRDEARNYCMINQKRVKDTDVIEWGEWKAGGQGRRSDLASAAKLIKEEGMRQMVDCMPAVYFKYARNMERYKSFYDAKKRKVTVEMGPYEDGMFYAECDEDDNIDWSGYRYQDTIYVADGVRRPSLESGYPKYLKKCEHYAQWTRVRYCSEPRY